MTSQSKVAVSDGAFADQVLPRASLEFDPRGVRMPDIVLFADDDYEVGWNGYVGSLATMLPTSHVHSESPKWLANCF